MRNMRVEFVTITWLQCNTIIYQKWSQTKCTAYNRTDFYGCDVCQK